MIIKIQIFPLVVSFVHQISCAQMMMIVLLQHVVICTTRNVSTNGCNRCASEYQNAWHCFYFVYIFKCYHLCCHQRLNPTGRDACPDCRTIIHGENGMRPVYLNYTSPDDFDMDVKELKEEKRVNKELTRQMIMVKKEIIGLNQQLQMEKEKSDRLLSRNEKIEHKLMAALATVAKTKVLKPTCSRCEANVKKGRQIMKSKQRHKVCLCLLPFLCG